MRSSYNYVHNCIYGSGASPHAHKEGRGMISEQFRFHLYTICMHMTLYYKGKGFSQFIEVMIPELLLLLQEYSTLSVFLEEL